jgi:hypothetical protein
MPRAANVTAILLYLLPVVVVLACRSRRERPLWAVAIDIPLAVACDLMVVLTLSRVLTLEVATLASRVLWLVGGAGFFAVRRWRASGADRPAWPSALDAATAAAVAASGIASAWLSMLASRPYSIWDRKFHTPLVSSLRGQSIPFENVFTKGQVLHYHFSGDVQAAMVQSLSGDVVHSSLALSIGHDIFFGLVGVTFALLLLGLGAGLGVRVKLVAVAGALATLLAGPFTLWRDPAHPHVDGYSVLNYLSLSFRPHDALAGLFYVGIVGALAARLFKDGTEEPADDADVIPALLGSTAGLAISDETSLGLIGLALGLTWLVHPRILHPRRAVGCAILLGMAVAFVAPNLAFAATIAPGAQRHSVALVPWRSPGCYTPTLPFTNPLGVRLMLADLGPTALVWFAGVLAAWGARRPRTAALTMLATALFALSFVGLTRIEVNHDPVESHRFMGGYVFLAPLLALLTLLPDAAPLAAPEASVTKAAPAADHEVRPFAIAALAIGALLGAASTVDWIANVLPVRGHHHDHFFTSEDLYALDCRKDLGATAFSRTAPRYLSKAIWYAYAGCQPSFAPAPNQNAQWVMTIGNPYFDKDAVRVLRETALGPEDPLTVVCQRKPTPSTDAVCAYALRSGACHDLGERLTSCELTPAQQLELLR